ncbi:MAG TPA: hypothetical protein VLG36_04410 [Candidatus Chromulinivoraceae bacterium]|nr:hypothetical protein [Candidatus Chromulinivoraceae bacterium]
MSSTIKVAVDPGVSENTLQNALMAALKEMNLGVHDLEIEVKGARGPWVTVKMSDNLPDNLLRRLGDTYKAALVRAGAIT